MNSKKSNLSLYIISSIFLFIIIIVAGMLAPFGVLINSEIYVAGEELMLEANETIQNIQNDTVRQRVQGVINSGLSATEENIDVNNDLFQYGWIAALIIFGILIFIGARQMVEVGRGGGVA